jgi:exosortase
MDAPPPKLQLHRLLSAGFFFTACSLLLVWWVVVRILWTDWRIDPQYGYGFLVPFLVVGLLMKRWEDRPRASLPSSSGKWIAGFFVVSSSLLLALVIPISEANPDWRPVGLLAAILAVMISLCFLYLTGGLRWLLHFSFPICFFLIAVPWPRNFEQSFMSVLMSWNTSTTLEILHWLGYEALRQGNLILIPSGVLGIEEACSGIRSLQSGLMAALFFGEIFRLKAVRRIFLLLMALGAALLGNIFRSSLLALVASRQGMSAVGSWHDPAGLGVLLITMGTIVLVALALRGRGHRNSPVSGQLGNESDGAARPVEPVAWILWTVLFPAIILMISIVGSEWWFRSHEGNHPGIWDWSLISRKGMPGVSEVAISPRTAKLLFYPEGFSERWINDARQSGQVFYFRWPSGRTSAQAVSMHNPEVCLSSIGMRLLKPLDPVDYQTTGVTLPFRSWLFDQHGQPVYVFQTLLEEGAARGMTTEEADDSPKGRLLSVLSGRRNLGQRMVEIALWGMSDASMARDALQTYLKENVRTGTVASPMNH